jgi:hypothetical protein
MSDLALVTADTLHIVGIPVEQHSAPAGVAITAGQVIRLDNTTGKWALSDADNAADVAVSYIASKTVAAGVGLTGIKRGVLDGFDLAALGYGDLIYVSNTAGALGTTAGTTSKVAGDVISGHSQRLGTAPDKLLRVNL